MFLLCVLVMLLALLSQCITSLQAACSCCHAPDAKVWSDFREVYFFLAACCLLVGATTTHGLGGSLRHKQTGPFTMELGADVDPRQPDPVTTWKFYQPFRCYSHSQYSLVSVLLLC